MNKKVKIPPSTIGTINELYVINDLLARGFSVFKSVSPSCACDLVAVHKSGECFRVEVKTGNRDASGKIRHTPAKNSEFDWLAIVTDDPRRGGFISYVYRDGVGVFTGEDVSQVIITHSGKKIFCSNLA